MAEEPQNFAEMLTPIPRQQGKAITMSLFDALKKVNEGKSVARISWGNTDYCLMKNGWLTIFTKGGFHTWILSDGDFEGEDYIVIKQAN